MSISFNGYVCTCVYLQGKGKKGGKKGKGKKVTPLLSVHDSDVCCMLEPSPDSLILYMRHLVLVDLKSQVICACWYLIPSVS